MKLFDIFKSKGEPNTKLDSNENTIWFHEDDFRQIELNPRENYDSLKKEIENPDVRFEAVYQEDNRIALIDRGIKPEELEIILCKTDLYRYSLCYRE